MDDIYILRFWEKVRKTDSCWIWTGSTSLGYGSCWDGVKIRKAHRFSYALHFGTIPDGLDICHSCDNPACVRPTHLFAGTVSDNMQDMDRKGRRNAVRGSRQGLSKLTEAQVIEMRALYASGNIGAGRLAAAFGVSKANVKFILKRRTWRHV